MRVLLRAWGEELRRVMLVLGWLRQPLLWPIRGLRPCRSFLDLIGELICDHDASAAQVTHAGRDGLIDGCDAGTERIFRISVDDLTQE